MYVLTCALARATCFRNKKSAPFPKIISDVKNKGQRKLIKSYKNISFFPLHPKKKKPNQKTQPKNPTNQPTNQVNKFLKHKHE